MFSAGLIAMLAATAQSVPALSVPGTALPQAITLEVRVRRSADDSSGRSAGTWRLDYRQVEIQGHRGVAYVSRFTPLSGRETIDSVTLIADGLIPRRERSHQPGKTMTLEFRPDSVVALVNDSAGAHRVATANPRMYFNSTDTPLAVLALPVTAGFRTVLQEYTYESGGYGNDTLSVERVDQDIMTARSATASSVIIWTVDTRRHTLLHATRTLRGSPMILEFIRAEGSNP